MNKLKIFSVKLLTLFLMLGFVSISAADKTGGKNLSKNTDVKNEGEVYRLYVNKIDLPINHNGKIADVLINDDIGTSAGRLDGKSVIYSSGFFLSGYSNGTMWTNGMASASRIEDYVAGTVDTLSDGTHKYPGIFVLKSSDEPFGAAWIEWKDAVEGGAYFYDGNNDGIYDPVDLNGNGVWDENEDKPDLLGDETVWCVYNDGLPSENREYTDIEPQGIEIRQTVWGYAVDGDLGNIIFLRYSMVNKNPAIPVMDSVFFGVWADPDLGEYLDDLVGSDVSLNAGFVYNDGDDDQFGSNPPTFLIDFFQGPWKVSSDPTSEAYNVKGPLLGIDTLVGYENLPITSFVHYMQGHPTQGDPDNAEQARNYLRGENQQGHVVDPCNWQFGTVLGEDCTAINGRFMYSGDPVTLTGWLNNYPTDQRQMSDTGPYDLVYNEPVDIVVAYVIGRSTSALNSVKETKRIDRAAQFVYQNNFNYPAPPPLPTPVVKTEDNAIELIWNTADAVNYRDIGNGYDMRFEGFRVNMYQSGFTAEEQGGLQNRLTVATYDMDNGINNVIKEDGVSLEREIIYEEGIQLDTTLFADPSTGWIKLRIEQDPFTKAPLIKGKPYFISISSFGLNYEEIVQLDALGNYMIPGTAVVGTISNIPVILSDSSSINGIVPGKDTYTPYREGVNTVHAEGGANTTITYSVYNKGLLTGHEYEVGFFMDSLSTLYNLFYYVKDVDTDTIIADSLLNYDNSEGINRLHDGVTLDVKWVSPGIDEANFVSGGSWAKPMNRVDTTGAFYVGFDVENAAGVNLITPTTSKITAFSDMRRVEIRFGVPSMAYRYVQPTISTAFLYPQSSLAAFYQDTTGFTEVPFSAWVKDDKFGEERQLAIAITETNNNNEANKRPDGLWNPGADISKTLEYIIVFNSDYDATGSNIVYTGVPNSPLNKIAQIAGYNINTTDPAYVVTDSMKNVAKSPWFNALAVVGLETVSNDSLYVPTEGVLEVPINYVLTPVDKFTYTVDGDLNSSEGQSMFDKVNVYPNPLFAYNEGGSYALGTLNKPDEPYVTFINLPEEVTIQIFSLSGMKIRELTKNNTNPMLNWNLKNEYDLRVASGMYIAVVSNPEYGEKVLKFAIIQPQKQIKRF